MHPSMFGEPSLTRIRPDHALRSAARAVAAFVAVHVPPPPQADALVQATGTARTLSGLRGSLPDLDAFLPSFAVSPPLAGARGASPLAGSAERR
jgi:hypothetical protein